LPEVRDRPELSGGSCGSERRKRLRDATDKLHELFGSWDHVIPSERRIVWEFELD
jgi:hypothetical protein